VSLWAVITLQTLWWNIGAESRSWNKHSYYDVLIVLWAYLLANSEELLAICENELVINLCINWQLFYAVGQRTANCRQCRMQQNSIDLKRCSGCTKMLTWKHPRHGKPIRVYFSLQQTLGVGGVDPVNYIILYIIILYIIYTQWTIKNVTFYFWL